MQHPSHLALYYYHFRAHWNKKTCVSSMAKAQAQSSPQPGCQPPPSSPSGSSGRPASLASFARAIAHDPTLGRLVENSLATTNDSTVHFDNLHSIMGGGKEPLTKVNQGQVGSDHYYHADETYTTYDTYTSMPSRDSEPMLCPPFPGGIIRFMLEGCHDIKVSAKEFSLVFYV